MDIPLPVPSPSELAADGRLNPQPHAYHTSLTYPAQTLQPGQKVTRKHTIYAGPKEYSQLKTSEKQIDLVMDFTGITGDEPLRISDVIHQANITVGEEGTEAAAATAVIGEAGSAPPEDEPVRVVFDRPFVFALRDRVSGAVLFLGRVADPRG